MATYAFSLKSVVRGYHEYETNPFNGEVLLCAREIGNSCDSQAVAVKKEIDHMLQVVGHVPRRTSSICSIFIRRGGIISCTITGYRRYSSDLPQGGLEVPCKLTFTTRILEESSKTKKLLESTLSVKIGEIDVGTPKIPCTDSTAASESYAA